MHLISHCTLDKCWMFALSLAYSLVLVSIVICVYDMKCIYVYKNFIKWCIHMLNRRKCVENLTRQSILLLWSEQKPPSRVPLTLLSNLLSFGWTVGAPTHNHFAGKVSKLIVYKWCGYWSNSIAFSTRRQFEGGKSTTLTASPLRSQQVRERESENERERYTHNRNFTARSNIRISITHSQSASFRTCFTFVELWNCLILPATTKAIANQSSHRKTKQPIDSAFPALF